MIPMAGEAGNRSVGNSGMRGEEGGAERRQGEGGARVLTRVKRDRKALVDTDVENERIQQASEEGANGDN